MTAMPSGASNSPLPILVLGNFSVLCGAFAIIGVLPAVRQTLGLTGVQAGMLITVYALTYALASPFLGWAATRMTYRRVLVIAALMAGLGATIVASASSYEMLVASRVAAAVGAALFTPTAAALALSYSEPGREGRTLSVVALGVPLSQVLGLPIAAMVGELFGWRMAFVVFAGMLVLVALFVGLLVGRWERGAPIDLGAFLSTTSDRVVVLNVLVSFLFSTAANVMYTFQAQIFAERGALTSAEIGIALSLMGAGTMAGTWLTGRSIERIGPARTLLCQGLVSAAVTIPMTLFSYGLGAACVLAVLAGAALFNHIPPTQIRLMSMIKGSAGLLFSVNASFIYLGSAAGGWLSGLLVDTIGVTVLGPAAAGVIAITLAYLGWLVRR